LVSPWTTRDALVNLHILIASTRAARRGPLVGAWFERLARAHGGFAVEVIDLAEVGLPLFDEPRHPRLREYEHAHTRSWSATIDRADAFVFVTPEYNHGTPPSLTNALNYLFHEWAYKPVGFVSYGGVSGGLRGVQMTKQVIVGLRMTPVVEAVVLPFFTQHIDAATGRFEPGEGALRAAHAMLDELLRVARALQPLRTRPG
jgi:NAD(P)H-dependent FMN reductase